MIIPLVLTAVFGFSLPFKIFQGVAQEELPLFVKPSEKIERSLYVPDEIIVKFKPGATPTQIDQLNKQHGLGVARTSKFADFKTLRIPEGRGVLEMAEIYTKNPIVEYAEPNFFVYTLMFPNDPLYPYQWHFDDTKAYDKDENLIDGTNPYGGVNGGGINLEPAWDISTGTTSVVVAVMDTGVAYEDYSDPNPAGCYGESGRLKTCRPAIIDTYYQAPDLVGSNFLILAGSDIVNSDDHPNDDDGHGTHVAGTVAQTTNNNLGVAGIAFNTTIMPVKVLDANGSGLSDVIADGIYFATNNGAKIINISLGSPNPSSIIENAVAYAYNQGVTVIAASGNDGVSSVIYPAGYDSYVIAVGATRYDETLSYYSNYGPSLDIVAPGGDVSVDQNNDGWGDGVLQQTFGNDTSDFGYWFFDGTSMAAPHVVGVAALLLAKDSTLTPNQIRNALESTAEDLGTLGKDDTFGWGLVDASAALSSIIPAVSISLTTDGTVDFGVLPLNSIQDNTNDVQTITINVGPVNLDAKSTVFSDGIDTWLFGATNGADQVKWEFSPDGTTWTTFITADTLSDLANNVAQGADQDLYLRITMPTETFSSNQFGSTVTIMATTP